MDVLLTTTRLDCAVVSVGVRPYGPLLRMSLGGLRRIRANQHGADRVPETKRANHVLS